MKNSALLLVVVWMAALASPALAQTPAPIAASTSPCSTSRAWPSLARASPRRCALPISAASASSSNERFTMAGLTPGVYTRARIGVGLSSAGRVGRCDDRDDRRPLKSGSGPQATPSSSSSRPRARNSASPTCRPASTSSPTSRSSSRRPSSPTTCCGRCRRSACSAARAASPRIRPRRACRCAASVRAASAARSCCSTTFRSTIRSAAGSTGRACR